MWAVRSLSLPVEFQLPACPLVVGVQWILVNLRCCKQQSLVPPARIGLSGGRTSSVSSLHSTQFIIGLLDFFQSRPTSFSDNIVLNDQVRRMFSLENTLIKSVYRFLVRTQRGIIILGCVKGYSLPLISNAKVFMRLRKITAV